MGLPPDGHFEGGFEIGFLVGLGVCTLQQTAN